ncbi:uncharacterized protein MONBRDRAFT_19257, partial [Monosiga brevicollis MX1]
MSEADLPLIGVIEGFYGRPWKAHQRHDLFALMNNWHLTAYMYAPKDDKKHRAGWREPYDQDELAELQDLIDEAQRHDVELIYAISPGLDMTYCSADENALLRAKLDSVAALGCNSFAILFDDIDGLMNQADIDTFDSLCHAHCTVANELRAHLAPKRMLFCPTEYCASRANPSVSESEYLRTIGLRLDAGIEVFWTGDSVIPREIDVPSLQELRAVIKRKPCIWDNIHANDFDKRRVFLGPYHGRSWQILEHVSGVLSNPNCEYHANFIPLQTLGEW